MIQAKSKGVRISPRKIRIIADLIRGKSIDEALAALAFIHKRAAKSLEKSINSAVANAVNNAKKEKAALAIDRIEVTEGTAFKRFHPSTRGRIHPYKKRSSHITITLKEKGADKLQVINSKS